MVSRDQLMVWSLESTRFHGTNVVRCEFSRGTARAPIILVYLPQTTLANLLDLKEALERFRGKEPILMVYPNMYLDEAQNLLSHIVSNILMEFSLINLMHHFRKHLRFRHLKTWTQVQQVTVLRVR